MNSNLIDVYIAEAEACARGVNSYTLRCEGGEVLPETEPGSHIDLHLPSGCIRQYSLYEAGPCPTEYKIAVKIDVNGRGGSEELSKLNVGQKLQVGAPRNNFPLVQSEGKTVLLAGGIGITPIFSMVTVLQKGNQPYQLYYCCSSRSDAAFMEQLGFLPNVVFHFDDEAGSIFDIKSVVDGLGEDDHIYCCGPSGMLNAFKELTAKMPSSQVHFEAFANEELSSSGSSFIVELKRSGQVFEIGENDTIIDTLMEAGVYVPSSCQQGVCGSCETVVLEGIPDHRDSVLSDEERADGSIMMICCSRAKSDRLVLDL